MDETGNFTELHYITRVRAHIGEVFEFHTRFENIKKIMPPYPFVRILEKPDTLGKNKKFSVGLFFVPLIGIYWESRVTEFEENRRFTDEQVSIAPFKSWIHEHEFEEDGEYCVIKDRVRYKMHFGLLGKIFDFLFFRHSMRLFFYYRSLRLQRIFGS